MIPNIISNGELEKLNASMLEYLSDENSEFSKENVLERSYSDIDIEKIFEEINRLSDKNDNRSVDEIIREAEFLMNSHQNLERNIGGTLLQQNLIQNKCGTEILNDISTAPENKHEDLGLLLYKEIEEGIKTIKLNLNKNQSECINSDQRRLIYGKHVLQEFNSATTPNYTEKKYSESFKDVSENQSKQNDFKQTDTPENDDFKENEKLSSSPANNLNVIHKTQCNRPISVQYTAKEKVQENMVVSNNLSNNHSEDLMKTSLQNASITREHILKIEIENLQEKLKDTEERLESLKIQHENLSLTHRDLRENFLQVSEESEHLKLDVQHLNECANVLRSELQAAKRDRDDALEIQKTLQSELDESRKDKKQLTDQNEKESKMIKDLQRQCKEMERILMRKHPDSVSALIVASKNSASNNEDSSICRRLLEQRIEQLESDAKEQDFKAQKILANVQAKFNSVQAKYETHIADLETQVLSLQEINSQLNEKIQFQMATLNNFAKTNENFTSSCTQTESQSETECISICKSTQTDLKLSIKSSLPNLNNTGSKRKPLQSKIPTSNSETQIANHHTKNKEDSQLLTTIRSMRIDLAIKDKAMQRLTKELEECKKTIKKLQNEKDCSKIPEKSGNSRKLHDFHNYSNQQNSNNEHALKEALQKIKLLEFDYKTLHEKRLQDLKTLQIAHEKELASSNETVRVLQQRLNERDEAFANQKRRKIPIDYYALKAKVTSLERRHLEREKRLHMLVEALSKVRSNGTLEDILVKADI